MTDMRSNGSAVFKRILVAVDEGEPAAFAVEVAARLAQDLQAQLVLMNSVALSPGFRPDVTFEPDRRARRLQAAQTLLNGLRERACVMVATEVIVREGDPAVEIVDAAKQSGADLIVMGTHGRGLVARAILGSVAYAVIRAAESPVMTVGAPPPSDGAKGTGEGSSAGAATTP